MRWWKGKHFNLSESITYTFLRYSNLEFTASIIPYADLYLNHHHTVTTTLTQYVNSFDDTSRPPFYVFDGRVLEHNTSLAADCPIPYLFENSSITLRQFILGPCNSGAPPHFHSSVFNVLVYGVKHWLIWRPHEAFFSFTPMDIWMTQHGVSAEQCKCSIFHSISSPIQQHSIAISYQVMSCSFLRAGGML